VTGNHALVTRHSVHRVQTENNFDATPLPELENAVHVQIATDGAHKHDKMGSAAIFEIAGRDDSITIMTQPTKHNPSANKAELAAIYMALLISHPSNRITLNYDCEGPMNDIHLFQKYSFTQRLKLKTKDFPLVQAIVILLDKFDHSVTFNKIPRAHNSADAPAKIAREMNLPTLQIRDDHQSANQYQLTQINCPNNTYPWRLINESHQSRMQETNDATLKRLWKNRTTSEIDCERTLQVATTGLDRKNHLDANLYQVQTHVINLHSETSKQWSSAAHSMTTFSPTTTATCVIAL
jgi:ribonuclease HI